LAALKDIETLYFLEKLGICITKRAVTLHIDKIAAEVCFGGSDIMAF